MRGGGFEGLKNLVRDCGYEEQKVRAAPLPAGTDEETVKAMVALGWLGESDGLLRITRTGFRALCRMLG